MYKMKLNTRGKQLLEWGRMSRECMRGIIKRNNSDTNAKVNRNVYGLTRVSFILGSSGREGE